MKLGIKESLVLIFSLVFSLGSLSVFAASSLSVEMEKRFQDAKNNLDRIQKNINDNISKINAFKKESESAIFFKKAKIKSINDVKIKTLEDENEILKQNLENSKRALDHAKELMSSKK